MNNIIENSFSKDELAEASDSFYNHLHLPMASQQKFESKLTEITGARFVLSCQSGTAALHLSLLSLGVSAGDEVFCPSFTYAAVPNAIVHCDAQPVFIDNEPDEFHISSLLIVEEIDIRVRKGLQLPKAIIVVHSYGFPAELELLKQTCSKYNIALIEDAAGALGAKYQNKHVGNVGSAGVISFNLNKIVSTAGGGALMTNDRSLYELAKKISDQGKDKTQRYKYDQVGYNYTMHPFAAELGRVKLNSFESIISEKEHRFGELVNTYKISNKYTIGGPDFDPNYWRIPYSRGLYVGNIKSEQLWKPLHDQKPFSKYEFIGSGNVNKLHTDYRVIKNI